MKIKDINTKRRPWAHKGQHGSVLVVGGSDKYSGSPIYNGLAALRTGADLATLVGPTRAMNAAAAYSPDLITVPLSGELNSRHVQRILEMAYRYDAVVIGGGLDRSPRTYKAIRSLIKQLDLPVVVDAEAIRALADEPEILAGTISVLTPHADEFKELTGVNVKDNVEDRKKKVKQMAKRLKTTILLKGHVDVISDGNLVMTNKTGSVYMTKGGFGDLLAGICGALLAVGVSPLKAAHASALINGKAGEITAKKKGKGMLASDALENIAKVMA